jgi:hypothetical protein
MPLSSQEIHFVFNRLYFTEMTFRIAFHENDVQIWFMEGNWNSWIFQFIYQSYIIKLNEKRYWMSFPWNTILNVISFKYNYEYHFREIQSVKYNTECHFREIEFWMSFLLNTILNVITVIYNPEMTFRIVCKRNDIQKCISRKWHSVLYLTDCISR